MTNNKKMHFDEIFEYTIIRDNEEFSFENYMAREYECGRKVGERDGLGLAFTLVQKFASDLFLKGKDHEAKLAREISLLLESSLKKS